MPDLEFDCPECGGELIVDAAGAGMEVDCPHCELAIRVPEPLEERVGPMTGDEESTARGPAPATGGEPAGSTTPGDEVEQTDESVPEEAGDEGQGAVYVPPAAAGAGGRSPGTEIGGGAKSGGAVKEERADGLGQDEKLARAVKAGAHAASDGGELFVEIAKFKKRGMKTFLCPSCAQPITIRESKAGAVMSCGACGMEITAPGPDTNAPAKMNVDDAASRRPAVLPEKKRKVSPKARWEEAPGAASPPPEAAPGTISVQPQSRMLRPVPSEKPKQPAGPSAAPGPNPAVPQAERTEPVSSPRAAAGEGAGEAAGEAAGAKESPERQRIWVGPSQAPEFTTMDEMEAKRGDIEGWEDEASRWRDSGEEGRRGPRGWVVAGLVLVLLLLGSAIYMHFRTAWLETEQRAIAEPEGAADVREMEEAIAGIREALAAFFAAETIEQLALHVRNPVRAVPRMKEHYGARPLESREFEIQGTVHSERDPNTGQLFYYVDVMLERIHRRGLALEKTDKGFKIDWESYVGHGELPWSEFLETRPSFPLLFRVKVSESSYFNFGFEDEKKWVCLRLTDLDDSDACYGYVERGSGAAERILNKVGTARAAGFPAAHLILQLQWPEESTEDKQVRITQVVRENWLLH